MRAVRRGARPGPGRRRRQLLRPRRPLAAGRPGWSAGSGRVLDVEVAIRRCSRRRRGGAGRRAVSRPVRRGAPLRPAGDAARAGAAVVRAAAAVVPGPAGAAVGGLQHARGAAAAGELDAGRWRAALGDVVARHEACARCSRRPAGSRPAGPRPRPRPVLLAARRRRRRGWRRWRPRRGTGSTWPRELADAGVAVPAGGGEHVLVLVVHHIAADGWSLAPLARDLSAAYAARRGGAGAGWAPLPVQYADYTLWQRDLLGDEDDPGSVLAGSWPTGGGRWPGCPRSWSCPPTGRGPRGASHRGGDGRRRGPGRAARAACRRWPGEQGATLFMVLQAALAALLTRLGAGTDIPLGTPIAGRTDEALDDLVGFFVNTLVLRTDTSGDPTFARAARPGAGDRPGRLRPPGPAVRAPGGGAQPGALAGPPPAVPGHAGAPEHAEAALRAARPEPGCARPGGGTADGDGGVRPDVQLHRGAAGGLAGRPGVSAATCSTPATAEAHGGPPGAAARRRSPPTRTRALADRRSCCPASASDAARGAGTTPPAPVPAGHAAPSCSRPRRPAPRAVAVADDGRDADLRASWTQRANRLAPGSCARGAGPDEPVGRRGAPLGRLVVALLAVLKAGAAYLPLDPRYPPTASRSCSAQARRPDPRHRRGRARPDGLTTRADRPSRRRQRRRPARRWPLHPDQAAYVIYTSGSTGTPKGVAVTQRSVADIAAGPPLARPRPRPGPHARRRPPSTPRSSRLWLPLLTGGTARRRAARRARHRRPGRRHPRRPRSPALPSPPPVLEPR